MAMDKIVSEKCACGNTFMLDSAFCRKCGANRTGNAVYDVAEVNHWELFLDGSPTPATKHDEPRTLQITYSSAGKDVMEIVYEDASEGDKRPRLLVSLESVLALKALCEREFDRVEVITNILKLCRTAYFKELQYLREQLRQVARPGYQPDGLENYEVYWYDPPEYIDTDMKVFLQDCIRLTNKKLIEENFELIQKLKALGEGAIAGDDADIIRMIRTLGPGGFVRKLYGFLCTQEHGSEKKRKDFAMAVMDLLKTDGSDSENDNDKLQAKLRKLQAQLDKLLKEAAESDALRKRIADLEAEVAAAKGSGASAAMEAARADAEKARADEAEAKALQLEAEMNAMRERLKELEGLKPGIAKLSSQVDAVVSRLAPDAKRGVSASDSILSPLEVSVSTLEGCIAGVLSKAGSGSSEADRKTISELNAQLKASQDNEAKLRAEIARLQAEAKRLKADRDAEAAAAARALAELEALRAAGGGDNDALQRELRSLREANERLSQEVEEQKRKMEALATQLAEADKERNRLREQLKNAGNLGDMEDAMEEMQRRLAHAHDKIKDLKAIIKRLKAQLGIDDDDDDDSEDSNYDGDMPMFLMSYTKRTRTSIKPRWKHLSEDARYTRQKREFLHAQKFGSGSLGQDAAMALDFLRVQGNNKAQQRASWPVPQRKTEVRSHSQVIMDENEPVQTALRAKETVEMTRMSQVLANDHLQEMSNRTGHPLFRFEQIAQGDAKPVEEACLAFKGAREEQRKKTASRESQSPTTQARGSSGVVPSTASRLRDVLGAVPPMVVLAQEPLKPVLPLQGMNDASASHQVFNKARELNVAALAERPVPRSPRNLSPSGERSLLSWSAPQERAVSSPGVSQARGRDVRPVVPAGSATDTQTEGAVAPPFQAVVGGGMLHQAGRGASRQRGSPVRSTAAGQPGRISPTKSGSVVGMGGTVVRGVSFSPDRVEGSATSSATPAIGSGMSARQMMSQLESIAASGQQPQTGGQQDGGVKLQEAAAINAGWRKATPAQPQSQAIPSQRQAEACKDILVPTSSPDLQQTRAGGLVKMQTPTEWAVDSHHRSPSPPPKSPRAGSVPVAVQRLSPRKARSRPASREQCVEFPCVDHLGSLSPGRSQPSSPGARKGRPSSRQGLSSPGRSPPPRQGDSAGLQEVAPIPRTYGPTLAEMLAHPHTDPRTLVTEDAPKPARSGKPSSPVKHLSKHVVVDALPTELSKESVDSDMLPLQDSITSTIASAGSLHQRLGSGSKSQASRGRALHSSTGLRSVIGGSAAAGAALKQVPTRGSAEFSPSLGTAPMSQSSSSWRPSPVEGTSQMSRSCSSFHPVPMEGASPPPRQTRTAGGQRDVVWGSRSTGSLPLTNAAPRNVGTGAPSGAQSATALKQKRRHPAGGDDRTAKAELAAANKEGHLPELLPAFKPGKIQKGPRPASWLVAV